MSSIEALTYNSRFEEKIVERNAKDRKNGMAWSLFHSLALEISEQGAKELRSFKMKLIQSKENQPMYPGSDLFKNSMADVKEKYMKDYADAVFGPTMRAIEMILLNNWFSATDFCKWLDKATARTDIQLHLPPVTVENWVTDEDRGRILALHKDDESHAVYLKRPSTLPLFMQEILTETQTVPYLANKTLPYYEIKANILRPRMLMIRNGLA